MQRRRWSRSPLLPSARSIDDDRRLRELRKDNKISAILHSGYPIRYWDKDLGSGAPASAPAGRRGRFRARRSHAGAGRGVARRRLRRQQRRPLPGDVLAATRRRARHSRSVLVRVDFASGDHTVIADDPDADLWSPAISPDGSSVAFIRESHSTPTRAPRITLGCLRFGEDVGAREAATDWDRWPVSVTWSADGDRADRHRRRQRPRSGVPDRDPRRRGRAR